MGAVTRRSRSPGLPRLCALVWQPLVSTTRWATSAVTSQVIAPGHGSSCLGGCVNRQPSTSATTATLPQSWLDVSTDTHHCADAQARSQQLRRCHNCSLMCQLTLDKGSYAAIGLHCRGNPTLAGVRATRSTLSKSIDLARHSQLRRRKSSTIVV